MRLLILIGIVVLGISFLLGSKIPQPDDLPLSVTPSVQNADWTHAWWLDRHQQKLEERQAMNNQVQLVFLGDSITHAWEHLGQQPWEHYYSNRKALNLGFSGDRTEHVLWRIANGAVDDISPKLVVLLIGTNNSGHRSEDPTETFLGIEKIIQALQLKLPSTKILLLAIFPRGKTSDDPMRLLVDKTNQLIQPLADQDKVFWLDINHHFVDQNGKIPQSVMQDYLHPNGSQYQVWAEAMEPTIKTLMQ